MRRLLLLASATFPVALAAALIAPVGPASAHAIIELNGVSAVAGRTSAMTLEIQHGCLPAEATTEVEAFVGTPWRKVTPAPVPGWRSSVEPLPKGGWHMVWTNLGEPIPFGTPTFFPITVAWPTKPGAYAMRVTQQCTNGTSYDWNTTYGPATASQPSPPLTPRPEVQVVAKAEKPKAGTHPLASTHATAHGH